MCFLNNPNKKFSKKKICLLCFFEINVNNHSFLCCKYQKKEDRIKHFLRNVEDKHKSLDPYQYYQLHGDIVLPNEIWQGKNETVF